MKHASSGALTRASLLACASLCAVTNSAFAASQTWDGETDATWATATNWVANLVPGSNTTTSNDVATFNTALAGITVIGPANPVVIDLNRRIGSVLFDTASVGPCVIGATGGNPLLLSAQLGATNSVSMSSTVTNSQTLAGPMRMTQPSSQSDNYAFINNSTTAGANLIIAGNIDATNTTRTWQFILDGTNTGNNIISGNINNTTTSANGGAGPIQKNGAGTWILSGTNIFSGSTSGGNNQHPIVLHGVQVNAGTLVLQNNLAFGNTAGAKVFVNGGVLELNSSGPNGGITLDNALTLTVANGATVRSAGTNATNSRISFPTGAGVNSTLSTVGAADVFTVGNAANDFTGGAADTVVHIAGPGTVVLSQASNYAGGVAVDAGTLNLGSSTALGTLGSLNVADGANVQTLGNSPTLAALAGSGAVSNGIAGEAILTTNIATSSTFAGKLQNGVDGTLGLTKSGVGTLNLSGASNYTDPTLITGGVLNVTGSLGNTAVSGGVGATLSGNGTLAGGVTLDSGFHVAPGDGGNANIGTLATGTLTLNADSQLDFGITDTSTLDKINVTTSGGLTINGGQLNINGGDTAFTANGVYSLIGYTGSIGGTGVGSLSVNGLNKSVTKNYVFGTTPGFVTLTVSNSGVVQTFWNVNGNGNWGTPSAWTPGVPPNAVGAFAGFGGGGTEITEDRTITVNGAFTVGTLSLNGAANGKSYTLAAGTGANITLNNGASGAFLTDTAGNHTIDSPLTLTGNGATFTVTNAANTLTIGGAIDGSGNPLVKAGAGTLVLNGANSYFNGTTINSGTVEINSDASLGDASNLTILNAATLRSTASFTSPGGFSIGSVASTISVAPDTTYTIDGAISDTASVGTLNKADTGTLVLTNFNTYTGGTVVDAGAVLINSANSLGDPLGALTLNSALLQATATFTGSRNVTLGSASSTISVDPGQTYTLNGAITGSGKLNKVGDGTLSLGSNANGYSGGTVISAGILALNNGSFLGPGTVLFQGGTLQNSYPAGVTYGMANPISVPAGQTGTINMGPRMSMGAGALVTGSGTLNINLNTTLTRDDLSNDWTGFSGQVNFAGSGTGRLLNNGGNFNTNSFVNSSVDIGGTAFLQPVTNSSGNTYAFGALSGSSAGAGITGGTAGRATLSIGALNTNTTFAGQINGNSAVTKVGTGKLILSGPYSYYGNTTVSAGTLSLSTGTLNNNATVNVVTGATLDLNFAGTDYVGVFSIDGIPQGDGVYGAVGSGAQFEKAQITGNGFIKVGDMFLDWIDDFAVGDLDGKADDADSDGLTNLEEFALDGNPADATPSGKVRSGIETVGTEQALVITLPVRDTAIFGGATSKAATMDRVTYTVGGSNDLTLFDQVVTEIAVSAVGLPNLSTGWSYRTFRLNGAIGGLTPRGPRGFLDLTITEAAAP